MNATHTFLYVLRTHHHSRSYRTLDRTHCFQEFQFVAEYSVSKRASVPAQNVIDHSKSKTVIMVVQNLNIRKNLLT
jgi:hypothetical protein